MLHSTSLEPEFLYCVPTITQNIRLLFQIKNVKIIDVHIKVMGGWVRSELNKLDH